MKTIKHYKIKTSTMHVQSSMHSHLVLGRGVEATGHGISGAGLGYDSAVSGITGGGLRNPLLSGTFIPGTALLNHL